MISPGLRKPGLSRFLLDTRQLQALAGWSFIPPPGWGRSRQRRLPREIWRLHQLLEGSGSIDWAVPVAEALTRAAIDAFEGTAFA